MKLERNWLDRITSPVAPIWTLRRQRARTAAALLERHYEAASTGRRTQGWYRFNTDANSALGPSLAYLRGAARDVVRNNPYAESALTTIVEHVTGTGIVAKAMPKAHPFFAQWKLWAESTDCDADGRHDFAGLEALVMRTVVESGECLVRRRWRRPSDGFALPMQLQILEPDFIDTTRDFETNGGTNRTIQGVEFDALGRRVAYWLFRDHPGGSRLTGGQSYRVPASDIQHVFFATRPGQVRAATWFANVLLRLKDFDEYEDATLMKQKIAACLAVITSDIDGTGSALGTAEDDTADTPIDTLSPGMILNVPPGRSVETVSPPSVNEYDGYARNQLRAIATGLGVSYEDLTGDYTGMPYSAARMSRIRHWVKVDGWRWKMLIPQFCTPAWHWAVDAAIVAGTISGERPDVRWAAPPAPMIEPDKEANAYSRLRRNGLMSLSQCIRERGEDPEEVLQELSTENNLFDKLGLKLDSDPRSMTAQGQAQSDKTTPSTAPVVDDDEEDEDDDRGATLEALEQFGRRLQRVESTPAPPITVNVTTPEVRVDAPITVHPSPAPDVRVEAPVTVHPSPAPNVQVALHPSVGATKRTYVRGIDGLIAEHVDTPIVDPAGR